MANDSWYIIEDCYGYYHPSYGGSCDLKNSMTFIKDMINGINNGIVRYLRKSYSMSYSDANIFDIHFYPPFSQQIINKFVSYYNYTGLQYEIG